MEYLSDILNEVASKLTENGRVELVVTLFVVGSCVSLVSSCAFAAAGRVRPSLFVVFFIGGLAVGHYFLSSLLPAPASFLHEEKLFNAVSSFVLFFALIDNFFIIKPYTDCESIAAVVPTTIPPRTSEA